MTAIRAVLACALLAVVLTGCTTTSSAGAAGTSAAPPVSGLLPCPDQSTRPAKGSQVLPPLSFACLGGGRLDLGKAPGVPTVVNLWASWCGPCRDELPLMQQLAAAGAGKVRVVGVVSKDGRPEAVSFAGAAHATFPSAFDGQGDLMNSLGLRGLPYTYFLDADGDVAYVQSGPVRSEQQLRGLVADHLGVRL